MSKVRVSDDVHVFPHLGGTVQVPLVSENGRESFVLDVYRGRISMRRETLNLRGRRSVELVRVDLGGPDHLNPDGEIVPTPHLHLYKEGLDDGWAEPIPNGDFPTVGSVEVVLRQFLGFCNVVRVPVFEFGLFT
jgi:hypothetical protein